MVKVLAVECDLSNKIKEKPLVSKNMIVRNFFFVVNKSVSVFVQVF
jgi:hypothetical protein